MGERERPELFFGIVGAVGAELDRVAEMLTESLQTVAYTAETISVIELLQVFARFQQIFTITDKGEAYRRKMDAGDDFRNALKCEDALALLSIAEVSRRRAEHGGNPQQPLPHAGHAYIFLSLKRAEEVERFRDVYGESFHLIGAYSPRTERKKVLAQKIDASSVLDGSSVKAEELIERDEKDKRKDYGQNVRETYPEADVFIDVSQPANAREPIQRYVELIFGNEFLTPTRDEQGMYFAFGARLRSGDLARQVGACITTGGGDVIATGTNDVPKAGGGLYWAGDANDHRDLKLDVDPSNIMRLRLYRDIVAGLFEGGVIDETQQAQLNEERAFDAVRKGRLSWVTEWGRSVYAEMAAITDAARRGVSIADSVLYTSTFPCHNCAKHIVSAGVRRAVYIHPYPKSQVMRLYSDSIAVDEPECAADRVSFEQYVGVAPRRYDVLFAMRKRKDEASGKVLKWRQSGKAILPRMERSALLYLYKESTAVEEFDKAVAGAADDLGSAAPPSI